MNIAARRVYIRERYPYHAAMSKIHQIFRLAWLAAASALLLFPAAGWPQSGSVEALLRGCADIEQDSRRLACYDQVLIPAKAAERPATVATPLPGAVPAATQAAPVAQPAAERPAPAAIGDEESTAVSAGDSFGLREKEERARESRTVTVQSIGTSLAGKHVYTTADGQVWVQIDARKVRYGAVPFEAEIRSASMGSFMLKPVSGGVSVKVRRDR
jgi:hypothetical protein